MSSSPVNGKNTFFLFFFLVLNLAITNHRRVLRKYHQCELVKTQAYIIQAFFEELIFYVSNGPVGTESQACLPLYMFEIAKGYYFLARCYVWWFHQCLIFFLPDWPKYFCWTEHTWNLCVKDWVDNVTVVISWSEISYYESFRYWSVQQQLFHKEHFGENMIGSG